MNFINSGELNKRITIQKYGIAQTDAQGFPVPNSEWGTLKTVWGSANSLYGREFWSAKAINEENTLNFIIRWSSDIANLDSKNYRIIYKTKVYDITFIDNIEESNTFYKIKAQAVN